MVSIRKFRIIALVSNRIEYWSNCSIRNFEYSHSASIKNVGTDISAVHTYAVLQCPAMSVTYMLYRSRQDLPRCRGLSLTVVCETEQTAMTVTSTSWDGNWPRMTAGPHTVARPPSELSVRLSPTLKFVSMVSSRLPTTPSPCILSTPTSLDHWHSSTLPPTKAVCSTRHFLIL